MEDQAYGYSRLTAEHLYSVCNMIRFVGFAECAVPLIKIEERHWHGRGGCSRSDLPRQAAYASK